ncbi:GNAT superfamily N-acetyltransferase [Mycoplana sp. BE70]|uniref:GNAT family N-acetyltransferase n=1 Tax=Mycoplana sp. BE70 TaxID=2817775 RepID=UPI0028558852|nr:GNAT family N-acetyltransferase [Mycoplana sp. BE70]MDR6755089.1 GNAT superfamily N-acetyltransferase [Mycoplana sp. BE70]
MRGPVPYIFQMDDAIEIRHGRTADVFAIGRVLVETWRATFRGQLDDAYLDRMSPAEQAVRHMSRRNATGVGHYVAIDNRSDALVGFANYGPARYNASTPVGEIYALYVLPAYQGRGIGGALVRAVARRMVEGGTVTLIAWVLSTNPNRAFYERLGATPVETSIIGLGGHRYEQVAYVWRDLHLLISRDAGAA